MDTIQTDEIHWLNVFNEQCHCEHIKSKIIEAGITITLKSSSMVQLLELHCNHTVNRKQFAFGSVHRTLKADQAYTHLTVAHNMSLILTKWMQCLRFWCLILVHTVRKIAVYHVINFFDVICAIFSRNPKFKYYKV